MYSTFSLTEFWSQGDTVSHVVTLILLGMSVVTWTIILLKLLGYAKQKKFSKRVERFWHASSFQAVCQVLGHQSGNVFLILAKDGVEAAEHLERFHPDQEGANIGPAFERQLHDQLDVSDWVTRALRNSAESSLAKLQSGLTFLASIGSTAPFIGLFGTVWGIYHALVRIGASGQTSLDQVAAPIGEALVMTALGLAVAIPAVLAYNALVRTNKTIVSALNRFAYDLHAYFVTGARIQVNDSRRVI